MCSLFMLEWEQNAVISQQRKRCLFLCGIAFIPVGKDFLTVYFSLLYEFTLSTAWVYIILLCQGSSILERINAKQCLCCVKVLCSGYVVTLNISAFLKNGGGPQYTVVSR